MFSKIIGSGKKWLGKVLAIKSKKSAPKNASMPGEISQTIRMLPLTPIENASGREMEPYSTRLRIAMAERSICNIAITGRFGAGKSSFLRTYFNNRNVLWVSLAPFINTVQSDAHSRGKRNDGEALGYKLERSILQQMFYAAKGSELPFSRFARIKANGLGVYLLTSILIVVFMVSGFMIWQPERAWRHVEVILNWDSDWAFVVALHCIVVPVSVATMFVCDIIRKSKIAARLNTGCAEVEIGKFKDDLVFNRAIDEVIYHFKKIKYEAVVFEDLDRYPGTIIFSKLKEMNHLVNSSREIPRRMKPIKFIYAIKDGILSDVDRVKFFDYILPILPTMSFANTLEVFVSSLRIVLGEETLPDEYYGLVRTSAQYIFDRRLLHNICNEFSVMKDRLGSAIPAVNLLGFVLYKNILPHDFEALQEGRGALIQVIQKKNAYIEREIGKKESLIKAIEIGMKHESGKSTDDLVEKLSEMRRLKAECKEMRAKTLPDLIKEGEIKVADIYEVMGIKKDRSLQNNNSGVRLWQEENRANLLFALINGGWVSENYKHYIVSYEDALMTNEDHEFVLSCLGSGAVLEDYIIVEPLRVITEIPLRQFSRRSVQNFSLLKEFLTNEKCPEDKKSAFLSRVLYADRAEIEFVDRFIDKYKSDNVVVAGLMSAINASSDNYLRQLVTREGVADEKKLWQLGMLFKCHGWRPHRIFGTAVIRYIASHDRIGGMFAAMGLSPGEAESFLSNGDIEFGKIDPSDDCVSDYLNAVIKTYSYELSEQMLSAILKLLGRYDALGWAHSMGTLILNSELHEVVSRIQDNAATFLSNVYLQSKNRQDESQSFLVWVLNNQDVNAELKRRFIEKQVCKLPDVGQLKLRETLQLALESMFYMPSWNNFSRIYSYCQEEYINLDDEPDYAIARGDAKLIVEYMNLNSNVLCEDPLPELREMPRLFIEFVLQTEEIDEAICEYLARGYAEGIGTIAPSKEMPINRIVNLARNNLVAFGRELYGRLGSTDKGALVEFIAMKQEAYLRELQELPFDSEIIRSILLSNMVHKETKVKVIERYCANIIEDQGLKDLIAPWIGIENLGDFPRKLVCYCFGRLTTVAIQCHVLVAFAFDRANTKRGLEIMISPYKDLIKQDLNVVLPKSKIVLELAERLKILGIVSNYQVGEYDIEVTTESSFPF